MWRHGKKHTYFLLTYLCKYSVSSSTSGQRILTKAASQGAPPKLPLFLVADPAPPNNGSLGPPSLLVYYPSGISVAVFVGFTVCVQRTHTDRPRYICNSRLHLYTTLCMRCDVIITSCSHIMLHRPCSVANAVKNVVSGQLFSAAK